MTLLTEKVEVKWHRLNREHYESKGYKFTQYGDSFTVKTTDLSKGSSYVVAVKCDFCGVVYERIWASFLIGRKTSDKDACPDFSKRCRILKANETRLEKGSKTVDEIPYLKKEWSDLNDRNASEVFSGSDYPAIWECSKCGLVYEKKVNARTGVSGSDCGRCSGSNGEKFVAKVLDNLGVHYKLEQTFHKLHGEGKGKLRYDFALISGKEVFALIEYDGKQHFKAIDYFGGEEQLKLQQQHDRIKDEFAEYYGVPIMRIRYDQEEKEVEEILTEFVTKWKEFNETVRSVLIIND